MQDTYKEVVIVLIAGSFIFLVLTGVVIYVFLFYQKKKFQHAAQLVEMKNSMQKEVLIAQLETQEFTYQQIGEEIHDNVGQLLSSTRMLLGITERMLPVVPEQLVIAGETVGKAIQELRSLSKSLNKQWLSQFNLVENLQAEVIRINASHSLHAFVECGEHNLPLGSDQQVMLFRVIQEALQNSIRHADASRVGIQIFVDKNHISVKISDDGKGIKGTVLLNSGMGLMNMKNRIRLLGGEIVWDETDFGGTRIIISIPLISLSNDSSNWHSR